MFEPFNWPPHVVDSLTEADELAILTEFNRISKEAKAEAEGKSPDTDSPRGPSVEFFEPDGSLAPKEVWLPRFTPFLMQMGADPSSFYDQLRAKVDAAGGRIPREG